MKHKDCVSGFETMLDHHVLEYITSSSNEHDSSIVFKAFDSVNDLFNFLVVEIRVQL